MCFGSPTSILPLSLRQNPSWLISVACSLPRYTSREEISQKLLFTDSLVSLKINVDILPKSVPKLTTDEPFLSASAIGMMDCKLGMITLHPVMTNVKFKQFKLGLSYQYH